MENNDSEKENKLRDLMNQQQKEQNNNSVDNEPNMLDGYIPIDNYDLPRNGLLYPEEWRFAYRAPESEEVANFSTINEKDQPAIIKLIEDLIRKCVVIYDVETKSQIKTSEINDSDRTYFFLKLRDAYLPTDPISWNYTCTTCHESFEFIFKSEHLEYQELNEKLQSAFDGRKFILEYDDLEEPIEFMIPTIGRSSKIFNEVSKVYKSARKKNLTRKEKIFQEKQFLLFAPYLFVTGSESIKQIRQNYQELKKDKNRYTKYLTVINKLELQNSENIFNECPHCDSSEESQINFPGGFKKVFVPASTNDGYFN